MTIWAGEFPRQLPASGIGEPDAQAWFEEHIRSRSAKLGHESALAHMDPPPADIAAYLVGVNAQYNQNLLHPDLSPFATEAENLLLQWLCPAFGMQAGHLCGGSTLANLTALWTARERGARQVLASRDAHISIAKAAHLLALPLQSLAVDDTGRLDRNILRETTDAALVLTAGTTGRGVIDQLTEVPDVAWLHVDAAWAGPLQLTSYSPLLAGIEQADSVAVSAHKWFYQPKESALVMFADPEAQQAISFAGSYLSTPNIGVQGSRGAAAIPLLATLLAWGRDGLEQRIGKNMQDATLLAGLISEEPRLELKQPPDTAVINWRARDVDVSELQLTLGCTSSRTEIDGEPWLRQVAVNPFANVQEIWMKILKSLEHH